MKEEERKVGWFCGSDWGTRKRRNLGLLFFLQLFIQSWTTHFLISSSPFPFNLEPLSNMNRSQDQKQKPAKPTTIHGCALSGDLVGLQRLLRDNPSLLNERNPVVRSSFSFTFNKWASSKNDLFYGCVWSSLTLDIGSLWCFVSKFLCFC